MRALVVEDELTSLRILESFLEGYADVEFATDASSAFDMFVAAYESNAKYDLLCLDINLPNASGLDLLSEVRDYEESNGIVSSDGVTVFMATGDSEPQRVFDSMSRGCTAYFTKPLDRTKFTAEIKRIFGDLPKN